MGEKVKRIMISEGKGTAEELRRSEAMSRDANLRQSGIGEHLTAEDRASIVKLAEPLDTKFIRDVHAWMLDEKAKPVLVLSGTVGRGKTYAAAWALAHRHGAYVPANEFIRIFSARFGDDREKQEHLLHQPLLVIDDVGREGRSNHEQMLASLVEVVDARRGTNRRTIIITNEDRRHFAERYGDERLISRLAQSGLFRSDSGQDFRRDGELPGVLPLEPYEECENVITPMDEAEAEKMRVEIGKRLSRMRGLA